MQAVDDDPGRLLNRELSWLAFNARVLELAEDTARPVFKRTKFMEIFTTNLDESCRCASNAGAGHSGRPHPTRQAAPGRAARPGAPRSAGLVARQADIFTTVVVPELAEAGIVFSDWRSSTTTIASTSSVFRRARLPMPAPLAVDPAHPFPTFEPLAQPRGPGPRSDDRRGALRPGEGPADPAAIPHAPDNQRVAHWSR
jgi:polyphosphate kinase